jgi:CO/xanthine dehydrogenase Mo-binding subunit
MPSLAKVGDKSKKLAAQRLEAAPGDMVFEDGRIYVRGSPDRAVTFIEVAKAAYRGLNLPPDTEPGLTVNAVVDALSPLGVRHLDMPLKAVKIWRILQEDRALRR